MKNNVRVDLLINPFCMVHRDVDLISNICKKQNVNLNIYNLWDINDEDINLLPEYMAKIIKEWRDGRRPGSVYCNVFVNRERIPLNRWPDHLKNVEEQIISALVVNSK